MKIAKKDKEKTLSCGDLSPAYVDAKLSPIQNGVEGQKFQLTSIADLSDDELYTKCQQYGLNARNWLRQFAGLLPEVAKRQLHRKKGFLSIHEFANKLGGMSTYAVDRILNIYAKLQDKPALLKQLESGAQGWSKIEKVAYIATSETDEQWARKVEILSTRSLEICVRDFRNQISSAGNSVFSPPVLQFGGQCAPEKKSYILQQFRNNSPHVGELEDNSQILQQSPNEKTRNDLQILLPTYRRFSFPISQKVDFELRLLKLRIEKEKKCSLSWDQIFEAVTKGEGIICLKCAKKKTIIKLCPDCARKRALMAKGRGIPAAVRQFIKIKYGEKCVFPKCKKPAEVIHHIKRFSLKKSHDLDCIVPLCKEHHELAHAGLIEKEEGPPEKWELKEKPEKNTLRAAVDWRVQKFKKCRKTN